MAAAAAAVEAKEFNFDDSTHRAAASTPDVTGITVAGFVRLRARLAAVAFLVSALTNPELCLLMAEIASLKPYYRGIIEQYLVQRMNAEPNSLLVWRRFKKSKDGNMVAFYSKYYDTRKVSGIRQDDDDFVRGDAEPHHERAWKLGERYHTAFAMLQKSTKLKQAYEYYRKEMRDSKEEPYSEGALALLKEACRAGNPDAHVVLIEYLMYKKDYATARSIMSNRILLGERFQDWSIRSSNYQFRLREYSFGHFFDDVKSLHDARKVLEEVSAVYIGVEGQIESKLMDRSHFTHEVEQGSCCNPDTESWEESEFTWHSQFLSKALATISEKFRSVGQKMITDYCEEKKIPVLTGEIQFFLANSEVDSESPYPQKESFDDEEDYYEAVKEWHALRSYITKDDEAAFRMVAHAVKLGNHSAYKFLTDNKPNTERQKMMCNKFRALVRASLP
ncbi:MAG: hypothetical protein Hyperionvirus1_7 [Hyperionvirus sp.]|uniref:Uncharacterized protein n=1 Tax=Hyperionvirus sp. TaxID=2487770 RepID=A0A3G5A5H2_9VIRU|nr:MAG: hypothetical protein Hyperionvirus1_7 [Hyperionvirus sp.]